MCKIDDRQCQMVWHKLSIGGATDKISDGKLGCVDSYSKAQIYKIIINY